MRRATGADGDPVHVLGVRPVHRGEVQRALSPLPVLKPNEAMIEEAVAIRRYRIGSDGQLWADARNRCRRNFRRIA
jgi:hypothetical protein